MSGFTKGPWISIECRFSGKNLITTAARESPKDPKVEICTVDTDWSNPFGSEQISNLNLIAAAPDLYEVLSSAMDFIRELGFENSDQYQAAVYALAKARGEQ